jgi:hypothetical protein
VTYASSIRLHQSTTNTRFKSLPVCTSSTLSRPAAVSVSSFLIRSPSFVDSWPQVLSVVALRIALIQDLRRFLHPFFSLDSFPSPPRSISDLAPSSIHCPASPSRSTSIRQPSLSIKTSDVLRPVCATHWTRCDAITPFQDRSLLLRTPRHI